MGNLSPEYKKLQEQLHEKGGYGVMGAVNADNVMRVFYESRSTSLLDFGCGQATLSQALPQIKITNYDPCIERFSKYPEPHDLVYCGDVMEHVEKEFVDAVIDELVALTKKALLVHIHLGPATKILADGRNAHITLMPYTWWFNKFADKFDVLSLTHIPNLSVTMIAEPKNAPKA